MIVDIDRWYTRCLRQLGINPEQEPEKARAAKDALACFADDPAWLAWAVTHSEWFFDEDNALNQTASENIQSKMSAEDILSGTQPEVDPFKELSENGARYGKRLPFWFCDFYTSCSDSCTLESYETYAESLYTPHFAQADGEMLSVYSGDLVDTPNPDNILEQCIGHNDIRKPHNYRRPVVLWIITTLLDPDKRNKTPFEIWDLLLSDIQSAEDSGRAGAPLSGIQIETDGNSLDGRCLRYEGGKSTCAFGRFENELAQFSTTLRSVLKVIP